MTACDCIIAGGACIQSYLPLFSPHSSPSFLFVTSFEEAKITLCTTFASCLWTEAHVLVRATPIWYPTFPTPPPSPFIISKRSTIISRICSSFIFNLFVIVVVQSSFPTDWRGKYPHRIPPLLVFLVIPFSFLCMFFFSRIFRPACAVLSPNF